MYGSGRNMYSSGRNMYSSVRSLGDRRETYGMQPMPLDRSVDYLDLRFRREDELANLQNELRNSRMEEERIRSAMKTQEHIFARNQEEVSKFRTWMEQRDVEMQRLKDLEERRLQVVLEEYRGRYERERGRLLEALNVTAQCTKKVKETLPECLQIEEQLFGRNTLIPIQASSLSGSGQFKGTTVVRSEYVQPMQPSQIMSNVQPSVQNITSQPLISQPTYTADAASQLASMQASSISANQLASLQANNLAVQSLQAQQLASVVQNPTSYPGEPVPDGAWSAEMMMA